MRTKPRRTSVLVVDDDDLVRKAICQSLAQEGYDATGAVNGADVTPRFWRHQFDAMILECTNCGEEFVFTADAQQYFSDLRKNDTPKLCKCCYIEQRKKTASSSRSCRKRGSSTRVNKVSSVRSGIR